MQSWGTISNGKGQVAPDQAQSWNTGMWSNKEILQLQENVRQYCNTHSIEEPSQVIFGMTKAERSGFYRDVSKDINRPLFAVYRKVIRIYDTRNYLGRYGKDELEQLKALHSIHGNNWQAIGAVLGRSPASVKDRCRLLAGSSCNRGTWTSLEEETLTSAVQEQTALSSWGDGSSCSSSISWAAVAAAVGTRTDKQCRAKWLHYLGWKTNAGTPWTKADDLRLICSLSVCGASEEHGVDWAALARGWAVARSPHWLRSKWWALKHRLPTGRRDSLAECCRKLYKSIPSSVLENTLIEMPSSSPALAASCSDQLPGNRSEAGGAGADRNSPPSSVRLCIPAAKFADIINADAPVQVLQQRLTESAAIFTVPSDKLKPGVNVVTLNSNTEAKVDQLDKLDPPGPAESDVNTLGTVNNHHFRDLKALNDLKDSTESLNHTNMQEEGEVSESSHGSEVYYHGVHDDDDIVYNCGVGALGGDVFIIDGEVCIIGSEVCAITNEYVDNDTTHSFEVGGAVEEAGTFLISADDDTSTVQGGGATDRTGEAAVAAHRGDANIEVELCPDLSDLQSRNSSLLTAADDPVLSTTAPPRQRRP